jgi:HlyD family secretion protein
VIKRIAWALAAGAVALLAWVILGSSRPVAVPAARASRQTLESVVTTNGKIEPAEWIAVRAERDGLLRSIQLTKGQKVRKGDILASFESGAAQSRLASAEARAAQARAELKTLTQGGRPAEIATIDNSIERTKLELSQAERDLASLERLLEKKAATGFEVEEARKRIEQTRLRLKTFERDRASVINPAEQEAIEARLRDANAAADLARREMAQSVLRAPMDGTIYQVDVRPGAFVTAGAPIAAIGTVDRLVAIVYVDEPELGRVRLGLPLTISWDAQPGRQWSGTVSRLPTQIVALGTRQVGEVACEIENRDGALLPGTNVNVTIRTDRAESVVAVPKEAVERRGRETGVFIIDGGILRWRTIRLGISDVTRVEVQEGLKEGELVALPSDTKLAEGMTVTPSVR